MAKERSGPKTNVLLVNPSYDRKRYMGGFAGIGWIFPPIGLLYVASYARAGNPSLNIQVYDSQVDRRDLSEVILAFKPGIVGISCQSALVYSTLATAKLIKRAFPDAVIIVGGVHASLRPFDLLESPGIDIVVRGEGEEAFLELCNKVPAREPLDGIPGICYKDRGEARSNPGRPLNMELREYPMPALDLVPLERYRISPDLRTGSRLGVMITARGCPYNCIFCANKLLTKRTYRARPIGSVIGEIEFYLRTYDMNQLLIYDDTFAVDRERTIELCNEFIRRGYPGRFKWWAEGRADALDEELLRVMKKAGCGVFSLGLESGNQRLLDLIKKDITLEQVRKAVGMIHDAGIDARATFILGLPTETREESLRTIKFAYSLPLDHVKFGIATPFPGTELWDIAVREGKVDPSAIDWTRLSLMAGYTDFMPLYYPEGRTPKELKKLQKSANLFFYLRPKMIIGYLGRIRSPGDLFHRLKGLFYFIKATFF